MKLYRDILLLLSVTGLLWSAAGCSGIIYDSYPADDTDVSDPVTLVLNVGLVSPTRAAADDNDREKMHSLRIMLLGEYEIGKFQVEYNKLVDFSAPQTEYKDGVSGYEYEMIHTTVGNKRIYLVANEESVTSVNGENKTLGAVLGNIQVDDTDAESVINSIWFTPEDYSGMNIPLSSSYEFRIREQDFQPETRQVEKEFYLVHAATKFEFEFVNNRSSEVQIDALSLSRIADNMYLMANFEGTPAVQKEGPDGQYWIDWLKDVSDETTANPNDPENEESNKKYGWIKDYQLPTNVGHMTKTLVASGAPRNIPATKSVAKPLDVVYFPESKYIPSGGTDQEYSFSITLTDKGSGSSHTFENLKLSNIDKEDYAGAGDNLVTLFRNTHVKIRCTINEGPSIGLSLHLHVIPWYPEKDEVWDYTDHVTVERTMLWKDGTFERRSADEADGNSEVITLKLDGTALEGTFLIDTPVNGRWHAYLTPIGDARPNAMSFVDGNGNPETPNSGEPPVCVELSDYIVSIEGLTPSEKEQKMVTIRILPTVLENDIESRYRLEFRVENMGMWIDAPVFGSSNYCTIVRPGNKMQ